jgi:hypothetical protein
MLPAPWHSGASCPSRFSSTMQTTYPGEMSTAERLAVKLLKPGPPEAGERRPSWRPIMRGRLSSPGCTAVRTNEPSDPAD